MGLKNLFYFSFFMRKIVSMIRWVINHFLSLSNTSPNTCSNDEAEVLTCTHSKPYSFTLEKMHI